jgi:hypothetical protein
VYLRDFGSKRTKMCTSRAKMDAAAKTAQAETRSKTKTPGKEESPKLETGPVETPKLTQPVRGVHPKTASLFHAPASAPSAATADMEEENDGILRAAEGDDQVDGDAEIDGAAWDTFCSSHCPGISNPFAACGNLELDR